MLGVLKVMRAGAAARWEWFQEKAKTRRARTWLGVYSFFDTLILPFPADVFLAIMVHADRARAVWLTILTTLASVAAAVVIYFLAYFFYDTLAVPLINYVGLTGEVMRLSETVGPYIFIVVFLGALTPIPYTAVILAAGFLRADFFLFIIASLLGRGLRYGLVTVITLFFGTAILPRLGKIATLATIVVCAILLAGIILFIAL